MLLAAPVGQAAAADWLDDTLRGSSGSSNNAPMRWDGIYFGGQLGVANSDTDFSSATRDFVSFSLRETALQNQIQPSNWAVMQSQVAHGRSYGAFLGYNMQWQELVLGGELAYNRASGVDPSAFGTITRVVAPSSGTDTVTITGQGSMKLNDYASFRARAGYAMGQFLPYGFVGAAAARFDYSRNLNMTVSGGDNGTFSLSDGKSNAIVAGFVTGLGLDVAVTPNVFVRAEWEYAAFAPISGIRTGLNTGRVGVGVRF
jgi:opacity protein-like surface antigen